MLRYPRRDQTNLVQIPVDHPPRAEHKYRAEQGELEDIAKFISSLRWHTAETRARVA